MKPKITLITWLISYIPSVVSTNTLMRVCDRYWSERDQPASPSTVPDNTKVLAANLLPRRPGAQVRDWARQLLAHPDYDARETGAWLIGELGESGQLGDASREVVNELCALIHRPFEDDPPKEAQAIDEAITSLSRLGQPGLAIPILRQILLSTKAEHEGDTQFVAAEALADLTGQPFMAAEDPIEAAQAWARTQAASESD